MEKLEAYEEKESEEEGGCASSEPNTCTVFLKNGPRKNKLCGRRRPPASPAAAANATEVLLGRAEAQLDAYHASHRLFYTRGVWWCYSCGAITNVGCRRVRVDALGKECPGRPTCQPVKWRLEQLKRGRPPDPKKGWPLPEDAAGPRSCAEEAATSSRAPQDSSGGSAPAVGAPAWPAAGCKVRAIGRCKNELCGRRRPCTDREKLLDFRGLLCTSEEKGSTPAAGVSSDQPNALISN